MHSSLLVREESISKTPVRPGLTRASILAGDAIALAVTILTTALLQLVLPPTQTGTVAPFLTLLLTLPLVFWLMGHYPAAGMSPIDELQGIVVAATGLLGTQVAFVAILGSLTLGVLAILLASWLTLIVSVSSGRGLVRHAFSSRPWWGLPTVVIGAGKTAELVIDRLQRNPGYGLRVVECLTEVPQNAERSIAGVPIVGSVTETDFSTRARDVSFAIVAMPTLGPDETSGLVQTLCRVFKNVVVIPYAFDLASIGVGTRDSGGLVGLYMRGHLSQPSNLAAKRVIDLMMLVPLSLIAVPLIAVCAAAVALVSPGNPFFSHIREGKDGRPIRMWKLRTMHVNSEALLETHLAANPDARTEWQTHFKLEKDPRIIPGVGTLLRRMSLDELPQLLNIATGEMSFVGPRPFPYYHLEQFDPTFRQLRTAVVPGLTGYWQVTSRSRADLVAQVELDSYYIRNWSLWFDLYILMRTPWAVLFGSGAY